MTDPTIATIDPDDTNHDEYFIQQNLTTAAKHIQTHLPLLYEDAIVTDERIKRWVNQLITIAQASTTPNPIVTHGPSLLILGPVGVGKTHQVCAAIRALAVSGASCPWLLATAAEVYDRLRPRHRIDHEDEFDTIANTTLLVLDDLGAAKQTELTEHMIYRLINHRYQWRKPTLITSNVPPTDLGATLGQRVASRLTQMTAPVILTGPDRRPELAPGPA